jgi:presenilin-like A22 family membrane protease
LPLPLAIVIAAVLGVFWFLRPLVWLHDLVLILALTSLGAVFGRFITPWTTMILLSVLAVYDLLAVRFGFMLWMADRLSKTDALPAIIIPKDYLGWNANLKKEGITDLLEANSSNRKYSILGGGDIAFPCLVTASVYFAQGPLPAAVIAVFVFIGLVITYVIHVKLLKGRPIPALPTIAASVLVGLLFIL